MSIKIQSKDFGNLEIPKEGFDKQSLLEKYLDDIRARAVDYQSEDKETIYVDRHNRIMVESAMKVGWIGVFDIENESPKKIAWLANGIAEYVKDCTTISPN